MATNLIEMVKGYLTPDIIQKASQLVGENSEGTQTALSGIVPTVLGGVLNKFSSSTGINQLVGMLGSGDQGGILNNVGGLFSGGAASENLLSQGQGLISSIFGGQSNAVADSISKFSGVKSSSALSLLSMVAPLVLGAIGKVKANEGLSTSGLASLLSGQQGFIQKMLPAGLGALLPSGLLSSGISAVSSAVTDTVRREPVREPSIWRWLLPLLVLGLLGLLAIRNMSCNRPHVAGLETIRLPGGRSLDLPVNSLNYELAKFLGDSGAAVPRTFVFDHLNFDTGTTNLTADSTGTITTLAAILNAYPNAGVQLDGHTDNTGDAVANKTLSQARADAVKTLLQQNGVDAGRISTMGYGSEKPVASNDTEEGRARNRRTELTVTKK